VLEGLTVNTLMSHLACGDEDHLMNARQRALFVEVAQAVPARRLSLANSAGICLGAEYSFDLTRPGLALYGGIARPEAEGHIAQVVRVEAQIVQRRSVPAGDSVGYNATFTASRATELAILNIGYADGYLRGFSSGAGRVLHAGQSLPVCGRVSMDLTAVDVTAAPQLREGDWLELDYHLPSAAAASGLSQYELLTTLGQRHARIWR
jgi:alanine racemase